MEPNVNAYTLVLFVQSVLLGISQLDFVTPVWSRIIVIGLIVVNAALLFLFRTPSGKRLLKRTTVKG